MTPIAHAPRALLLLGALALAAPRAAAASYFSSQSVPAALSVAFADGAEAVAALRSLLGALPAAASGARLPTELSTLLDDLARTPRRPLAIALLRSDGKPHLALSIRCPGGDADAALTALTAVGRWLKRSGVRRFFTRLQPDGVQAANSKWSLGWIQRNGPALLDALPADKRAFRVVLDAGLGAAPTAAAALPLGLVSNGTLGGTGQLELSGAAVAVLRATFAPGVRRELGFLPAGVRALARAQLRRPLVGPTAALHGLQVLPSWLEGALTIAQLDDRDGASRLALYVALPESRARERAAALGAELRRLLPGLKLEPPGAGRPAAPVPCWRASAALAAAERAALAGLGLRFPRGLTLSWAVRGGQLVIATDPSILAERARPLPLPAELQASPLWSFVPRTRQSTRLQLAADKAVLVGPGALPAARLGARLIDALPGTLLGMLLRDQLLEAFSIPSGTMQPTLLPGDQIFVDKRARAQLPARGDLVLFTAPGDPSKPLLKRVVALPGETVSVDREGQVSIDGQSLVLARCRRAIALSPELDERGKPEPTRAPADCRIEGPAGHEHFVVAGESPPRAAVKVPPDHVYVLGDNRPNSFDSRHFGSVPLRSLGGRALLVWASFDAQRRALRWFRTFTPLR